MADPKGKPLKDYLDDLNYFSGKASEINRTLAVSGFAVIWLFKYTTKEANDELPPALVWPALMLLISIALDLFHYIFGYLIWKRFYHKNLKKWKDRQMTDAQAQDIEAPKKISNWVTFFSLFKIVPMIIGYTCTP